MIVWFAFFRLFNKPSILEDLGIACQLILITSILPAFLQPFLLTILIAFFLGDYFLFKIAGIRLRPSLLSFFSEVSTFHQSIPWKTFTLFILSVIFGCVAVQFLPQVQFPGIPVAGLLAFCGLMPFSFSFPTEHSNLFFLWESDLIQANRHRTAFHPRNANPMPSSSTPTPKENRRFHVKLKAEEKPHVIFLFLESFRAKNVGCLGCPLGLSPSFDKWSNEGILFSQFHSNGILTSTAMISSLFGILPMFRPSYLRSYLSIPLRGIPQILKETGYENGMILGGPGSFQSWERFFETNDFDEIICKKDILNTYPHAESTSWGVQDEWIYKKAFSWLQTRSKPAFLTLLTATHHHPWLLPDSWRNSNCDHPYHQTFAYSDWALGKWLEDLDKSALMENCLIFIFGDHGQELGERGEKSFVNRHLYQENIHVPLLLLAKGRIEQPMTFSYPCSQVDLLPTLLDLLGIETNHHGMGESLLRKERTGSHFFLHPFQESLVGVREGSWKCILNLSSGKKELFNLEKDPLEMKDQSGLRPVLTKDLEKKALMQLDLVETLYSAKTFVPTCKKTACLDLDFSKHNAFPKEKEVELEKMGHQIKTLNFSHRLFVCDEFLRKYSVFWTQLSRIDLSHCLLVSDKGINTLIQSCKELEEMDLQGLDELSGAIEAAAPHLRLLNLLDCDSLQSTPTIRWISQLASLSDLGIDGENFTENDWHLFFERLPLVSVLYVQNGIKMTPDNFSNLLEKNPYLKYITLENCPEITDQCLASLKNRELRSLCLTSCLKVTSRTLDILFDLPLQKLFVKDCPEIKKEAIERWRRKKTTLIHAS